MAGPSLNALASLFSRRESDIIEMVYSLSFKTLEGTPIKRALACSGSSAPPLKSCSLIKRVSTLISNYFTKNNFFLSLMSNSAPVSALRNVLGRVGSLFRHAPASEAAVNVKKAGINKRASLPPPSLESTTQIVQSIVPPTKRWTTVQIQVPPEDAQRQLSDIFCRNYDASRPLMQRLIRLGKVQVSRGRSVEVNAGAEAPIAPTETVRTWIPRENMRVKAGDLVAMTEVRLAPRRDLRAPRPQTMITDDIKKFMESLVLYQDDRIVILNKPTGIATHGGPKLRNHLEGWLEALKGDSEIAPLLTHRLDKGTSGVLILAKTRPVAAQLASMLRQNDVKYRKIQKVYWAMVKGVPGKEQMEGRYSPLNRIFWPLTPPYVGSRQIFTK